MKGGESRGLIIGVIVGVIIGILIAIGTLFCIKFRKSRSQIGNSSSRRMRSNSTNTCTELSDSTVGPNSPNLSVENGHRPALWIDGQKRKSVISVSGIPKYSYKYVGYIFFNDNLFLYFQYLN
jgi:hypothetical protein